MNEIKAMETLYKGFRFRSRLEARWAMFYDRVGIQWEFEPQPVLINGEPYLPDFFVQHNGRRFYHEVKSSHEWGRIKPVLVYMAGKMGQPHNWRGDNYCKNEGDSWFQERTSLKGSRFTYVGPFMSTTGHGVIEDFKDDTHWASFQNSEILDRCRWAIKSSDIVCVHLSTLDAFATLMEIGYAHAHRKIISLSIDSSLLVSINRAGSGHTGSNHELWFAQEMANEFSFVNGFDEAQQFHAKIINSMTTREYRLIAGLGSQCMAAMTFGDPLDVAEGSKQLVIGGPDSFMTYMCSSQMRIAQEIRAHRFDRR